jgi:hypothetical protein
MCNGEELVGISIGGKMGRTQTSAERALHIGHHASGSTA